MKALLVWLVEVVAVTLGLIFWTGVRKLWRFLKEATMLTVGLGFVALLMVWLFTVLP